MDVKETPEGLKLQGPVLFANTPNTNGLVYPRKLLKSFVKDAAELIETKRLCGSVGQKDRDSNGEIPLMRISHKVERLWFDSDSNALCAEVSVLDTPAGVMLRELVKTQQRIEIKNPPPKLRLAALCVGSVNKTGVVQRDASLTSVDVIEDVSVIVLDE